MKLIIDINKEIYESSKRECEENDDLIIDTFTLAIGYGTPIPDNATNGEVMKIMFMPNQITRTDNIVHIDYDFTPDWWNSPYKKGGKECCETNCESCTHYGEDLHGANCRFCHEYSRYERR